jgi:hypothetical protein
MNNKTNGKGNFDKFAEAIRMRESGDNYNSLGADPQSKNPNNLHYGAYQMGYAALAAAGFVQTKGDLTKPTWTPLAKSMGVDSVNSFLASHTAQDFVFGLLVSKNDESLRSRLDENAGKIVKSQVTGIPVYVTESGVLAAAHLVGASGVKQYFDSSGKIDKQDGNHVHLSEYMADFAGYGFTFNAAGEVVDMPNVPAPLLAPGLSAAAKVKAARDLAQEAKSKKPKLIKKRHKQPGPMAPIRRRLSVRRHARPGLRRLGEAGAAHQTSAAVLKALRQEAAARREPTQDTGNEAIARPWKHTAGLAGRRGAALLGGARKLASASGIRAFSPARRHASTSASQMSGKVAQLRSVSDDKDKVPRDEMAQITAARRQSQISSGGGKTPPSLGASFAARAGKPKMGSLAPIGAGRRIGGVAQHKPGTRLVPTHEEPDGARVLHPLPMAPTSDVEFARRLDDVLSRQARLPPSGATGFDPRLTPAWAGLKLSV